MNDLDTKKAVPKTTETFKTPESLQETGDTVAITVMASCAVTVTPAILNSTAAAASVKGAGSSHAARQSGQRRGARAAQLRCKPVNVYPVPPTRGVPGSAVPITIELAITVRVTEKGGELVLAGVPVDVNLPASVIVHTPM